MKEESANFDDILISLETGKWNFIHFIGMGLCGFLTASNVLGGAFLTPNIDHTCAPSSTLNVVEVSNCTFVTNSSTENSEPRGLTTERCSQWAYENDTFSSTITSDFDLVCENNYWRATFQTVYMIGNFFGSPLNGIISDKLGRRLAITTGSIVFVTCSIATAWMSSFKVLLGLRFILGIMHPAVLQTGYVLCMEICAPKHRSTVGILLSLPWALGTMWWGLLGYLIRDWRNLQMAASFPGLIILVFICFFDESPRWLIINGKHEQAYKILEKASRWNNSKIKDKDQMMDTMKEIQQASSESHNASKIIAQENKKSRITKILQQITILFRTPRIRKRTLLMYVNFIVASTVYYGLSLNGKNFSADPFIYMILTGLMEVPAYTFTAPIVAKLGRRIPTSFCYSLCGVTILVLFFIQQEAVWLTITLAMVGKLCISAAYQIIYLISSEIFPTEVRLQGLGTSNLISRIGSISAPFITDILGTNYPWAPSVLFGCVSIVAGISTLFLPETLNMHLPETVYELENNPTFQEKVNKDEEIELSPSIQKQSVQGSYN